MPEYVPARWADVEVGAIVLGRDGRERQIISIYIEHPSDPIATHDSLIINVAEGTFRLDPRQPTILVVPTMQDAVVTLMSMFAGSEIVGYVD